MSEPRVIVIQPHASRRVLLQAVKRLASDRYPARLAVIDEALRKGAGRAERPRADLRRVG